MSFFRALMIVASLVVIRILDVDRVAMCAPPDFDFSKAPPAPPARDKAGVSWWGVVGEVTKQDITIRTGKNHAMIFAASETLAAGEVASEPRVVPGQRGRYHVSPSEMYRLSDVKVGDWVQISYSSISGVLTCDHICIRKRYLFSVGA